MTAATDANTGTGNRAAQANSQINYIRNSVKATVDAYTGQVKLYAFDKTDPVLKTWMKAFPGTVLDGHPARTWRLTCTTPKTCSRCSAS